jgi:hypothetical protein
MRMDHYVAAGKTPSRAHLPCFISHEHVAVLPYTATAGVDKTKQGTTAATALQPEPAQTGVRQGSSYPSSPVSQVLGAGRSMLSECPYDHLLPIATFARINVISNFNLQLLSTCPSYSHNFILPL